jgi:antirestriction protein ArdC
MAATRKPRKTTTRKSSKASRDIYQEVTDRMVAALEKGTVPWRKPWNSRKHGHMQNLVTGHPYRGINIWLLSLSAMEHGFTSPYWLSRKQIIEAGGSWSGPGTQITFWRRITIMEPDETGKPVPKTIPLLKHFYVWNLDQTEGVKLPKRVVEAQDSVPTFEHTPVEEAERVIAGYIENGPTLRHGGDRAFYNTLTDVITVPEREDYANGDEYYATLFHEMTHSTGHKDRLNRKYGETFGDHDYGREELVAEMGSAFLQAETGIESAMDNSAAYLASWIKTIKEDVKAVVVAAGAAQKAADRILGRVWQPEVSEDGDEAVESAEGDLERQAA